MTIVQDVENGQWWDTDQPRDLRDLYPTQQEAEAAKARREAAFSHIPPEVWSNIGDFVGNVRPVGVGGRYVQEPKDLAHLAGVDHARHDAAQPPLRTTAVIEATALHSETAARKAALTAQFGHLGLLQIANGFAADPNKNRKLPAELKAHAVAAYELRSIVQREQKGRGEQQKDGFLRYSAALGLDVVRVLESGLLCNPAMLPEHIASTEKELAEPPGILGSLAEYLTLEEEVLDGRHVVAGAVSPAAWLSFSATQAQLPAGAKDVGGDRTTFVRTAQGLTQIVTTQQKVVMHRGDVGSNITDAANQLRGRSKPPEVPLLGSVHQVHIILPYPQVELLTVADQVDSHRSKRQRIEANLKDGETSMELEQEGASLEKAIRTAHASTVDLDAWCKEAIASAAERKDFKFARYVKQEPGEPAPNDRGATGFVLLIDLPHARYRAVYAGDGSAPVVHVGPRAAFMRLLDARVRESGAYEDAENREREHQQGKLKRKRRGQI